VFFFAKMTVVDSVLDSTLILSVVAAFVVFILYQKCRAPAKSHSRVASSAPKPKPVQRDFTKAELAEFNGVDSKSPFVLTQCSRFGRKTGVSGKPWYCLRCEL